MRGLERSLSKPYLAVALWLIQLLLAAVVILPVSNSLHALLDHSPAADTMVANPDYGWWETLRRTHPDLLGNFPELATGAPHAPTGSSGRSCRACAGIGASAFSLALLADRAARLRARAACSGRCASRRARSSRSAGRACGGCRRSSSSPSPRSAARSPPTSGSTARPGGALRDRVRELRHEPMAIAVTALRLLALCSRPGGHQAPRRLGAGRLGRAPGPPAGVALPLRNRRRAGTAAAGARDPRARRRSLTALLYVIWLVLDPSAGGEARFALVPLILAQQVFVFVRLLIKIGYYAGMSEALTRAPSPEYSYVASGSGAFRRGRTRCSTARSAESSRTRYTNGWRRIALLAVALPRSREPRQEAQVLDDHRRRLRRAPARRSRAGSARRRGRSSSPAARAPRPRAPGIGGAARTGGSARAAGGG